jgi:RNAse (barnase) inhibitor barstar
MDVLNQTINGLEKFNYTIKSSDASNWENELKFHKEIAMILDFPDYYGENLNAFNDCLRDLEIPYESGYAIIFYKFNVFAEKYPKVAWTILDILEDQSRSYLLIGKRLIALIQTDDPAIQFEPVGARAVNWNNKEWLKADRGL